MRIINTKCENDNAPSMQVMLNAIEEASSLNRLEAALYDVAEEVRSQDALELGACKDLKIEIGRIKKSAKAVICIDLKIAVSI